MKPLLILFAKAPVPGRVKTRLTPFLTALKAAELHERLVAEVWKQLKSLNLAADAELHTDVGTEAWPEAQPRKLQSPGDLGIRMLSALGEALAAGRPKAILLGSDIWNLPEEHLRELLSSDADVALGPVEDGGYYAIACRRTDPRMFAGVRWSTAHALSDTVSACLRCGLNIHVGQPWYDIDTPEDLKHLPEGFL